MVGVRGESTLMFCVALTDKDTSLSNCTEVNGGLSAADCPTALGSCLLAEDKPSPPFPPGGAPTAGVSGPTFGVFSPADSSLAYSYNGNRSEEEVA